MKSFFYILILFLFSQVKISGQTITINNSTSEYNNLILNLLGPTGSPVRNWYFGDYVNSSGQTISVQIIWESWSNKWVVRSGFGGFLVNTHESVVASFPNPPNLAIGNWMSINTWSLDQFTGTGTTCLHAPSFTSGATTLCAGATSTYIATAIGAQSTSYSIIGGTGATINSVTGVVSNVTGDFTVRATFTNACGGSSTFDRPVFYNCGANNALNFDGSDDKVVIPGFSGLAAYTIEGWIRPGDGVTQNIITGGNGSIGAYSHQMLISNGNFQHRTFDGSAKTVTGTTTIVPNQWYHIAITALNNGQMRLFVNGIEEGTSLSLATLWTGLNTFSIGPDLGLGLLPFFGTVDEFRVWNVARTPTQIQATMNSPLVGNEPGLISYIKFNQGTAGGNNTAGHLLAQGITGSNGTLEGFALTGASSNFVVGVPAVGLPVELLSFNGKNTGESNLLTWQTAGELNNSHFFIERSTDGTIFQEIGKVKGNNKPSIYEFYDNQPYALNYYRLKQIDFDGTESLSKIISIAQNGNENGLVFYPNPVSHTLTVEHTEGPYGKYWEDNNVQILNLLGQQVLTGKTGQQMDVSILPQGTYILKSGAEQAKFVKQ
jgi:hypothetical protein